MRGIRGWIRNLADGLGPPASSVGVSAKPTVDSTELDLTTHKLGSISRIHVNGGSGSSVLADGGGHFGWDVELSPGPMNIAVTPTDPQTEYRKRFPDESAQIGKAYMTDLERLGWAGGRDHVIWNAVFGGNNPTAAQWSTNPATSWSMGNGSIAQWGSGGSAGRLTIRQFIAMLGGVPFTVELGDLVIPVTGDAAMTANASGTDRWDVICAAVDWNPASDTYGKQKFEFTPGIPGGGIPAIVVNGADNWRRLPLHAVKMAAGASVYSDATDLRTWLNPPPGVTPGSITQWPFVAGNQQIPAGFTAGSINTTLASNEIILPLGVAWDGMATLDFKHVIGNPLGSTSIYALVETAGRVDPGGPVVTGTNYATTPIGIGAPYLRVYGGLENGSLFGGGTTLTFPLSRIPAYAPGGGPSLVSRTWTRLRFVVTFAAGTGGANIIDQRLAIHLWPVP